MDALRRAVLPAAVLAAALLPAAANASRPDFAGLTQQASSAHFTIHYAPSFDAGRAQQALGWAEQAYARELELGFPAPRDDGDGHIDVYVTWIADPTVTGSALVDAIDGTPGATGFIELDPSKRWDLPVVGHELFHLIQFREDYLMGSLLEESTATWMQNVLGAPAQTLAAPVLWTSFVCQPCVRSDAARSPYSRWSFFKFLSDRYGTGIVKEILDATALVDAHGYGVAAAFPTWPIDDVLRRRSTTFADAYAQYAVSIAPSVAPDTRVTLTQDRPSASASVSIDPGAARVVAIDESYGSTCTIPLRVTVTGRGGVLDPQLLVNGRTIPLAGSADALTATATWTPCGPADAAHATVVVPNTSTSDAATEVDVRVEVAQPSATAAGPALAVTLPASASLATQILPVRVDAKVAGTLTVLGAWKPQTFAVHPGANTIRLKLVWQGPTTLRLTFVLLDRDGRTRGRVVRAIDVRFHG